MRGNEEKAGPFLVLYTDKRQWAQIKTHQVPPEHEERPVAVQTLARVAQITGGVLITGDI